MNPIASFLLIGGALVALLAGIGLIKFKSPYARFHAAGKASPIAFLIAASGAGIELGWSATARLAVAAAALILTLPIAVHLLFRALHRTDDKRWTTDKRRLVIDELASDRSNSKNGDAIDG